MGDGYSDAQKTKKREWLKEQLDISRSRMSNLEKRDKKRQSKKCEKCNGITSRKEAELLLDAEGVPSDFTFYDRVAVLVGKVRDLRAENKLLREKIEKRSRARCYG